MEFGDMNSSIPDNFVRADLNVAQVESIRGGSSSTFASNAPGGVINLISKTGEVEGGSVMGSIGLDYQSYRTDFDYGGHLGGGWRFHIGGFYRDGQGPRTTGSDIYRGGQVKFNVTKQFDGGYIRVYGKLLDDHYAYNYAQPVVVSGTNANPKFTDPRNYSVTSGSLLSPYINSFLSLNSEGQLVNRNLNDGIHSLAKSLGLETQFTISDWTVSERFRYADQSSHSAFLYGASAASASAFASGLAGPGAQISYASGPLSGQAFDASRGTGLMGLSVMTGINNPDLSNMTNDLRVSRVWEVGGGDLTTTAGLYRSSQKVVSEMGFQTVLHDIVAGGQSSLLDVATAGGTKITDGGVLIYGSPAAVGSMPSIAMTYTVTAPFASFNFHKDRIAIGGSIRYDSGRARGRIANDLGTKPYDMNGNGTISIPEMAVSYIPVGLSYPVNYDYHYLSYSTGINFRVSDPLAVFARYSRGSRAAADKILFTAVSKSTGQLVDKKAGYDPVKQAEVGVKFRKDGITLNLTGFYATVNETNLQLKNDPVTNFTVQALVSRSYKAYGAEFEGSIRRGPFSLNAGATLTHAEITAAEDPAVVGKTPRHQPTLMFQLTPQFDVEQFTFGVNVIGVTKSYTQDVNQLRLPGYTTVGAFAQYRPVERVELSVNASNLFDTLAITDILDASVPASGVSMARTLYGRTVSASARFFF